MNKEDKNNMIELLETWEKKIKYGDELCDKAQELFGIHTFDGSLFGYISELQQLYTSHVASQLLKYYISADMIGWLEWYQSENDFGEKGYHIDDMKIHNIQDLLSTFTEK